MADVLTPQAWDDMVQSLMRYRPQRRQRWIVSSRQRRRWDADTLELGLRDAGEPLEDRHVGQLWQAFYDHDKLIAYLASMGWRPEVPNG